jgi:hypothetical protein
MGNMLSRVRASHCSGIVLGDLDCKHAFWLQFAKTAADLDFSLRMYCTVQEPAGMFFGGNWENRVAVFDSRSQLPQELIRIDFKSMKGGGTREYDDFR